MAASKPLLELCRQSSFLPLEVICLLACCVSAFIFLHCLEGLLERSGRPGIQRRSAHIIELGSQTNDEEAFFLDRAERSLRWTRTHRHDREVEERTRNLYLTWPCWKAGERNIYTPNSIILL